MADLIPFGQITDVDAARVGGKGHSLGRTAAAGLPVPPGFVVTTDAYRRLQQSGVRADRDFVARFAEKLHALGDGPVAVRSSATGEDGSETSFAGQQETILGVRGLDAVLDAVERCWASLHTERAKAYRAKQGVEDAGLAMAVVVQELVPADAAGVLFTRDPLDATGRRMLVEASWGLGEVVVSGRVTPDRFQLDRDTGAVLDRQLGAKDVRVTAAGEEPVPAADRARFCLSDDELSRLADLSRRVEAFAGEPRDVEWAVAGGRVFLQSRPITVATAADPREALRESVEELRAATACRGGTVWVLQPERGTAGADADDVGGRPAAAGRRRVRGHEPRPGGAARPATRAAVGVRPGRRPADGEPVADAADAGGAPAVRVPVRGAQGRPPEGARPQADAQPARRRRADGMAMRLPATVWRLMRLMSRTKREAETFAERFTTGIVLPRRRPGRRWPATGRGCRRVRTSSPRSRVDAADARGLRAAQPQTYGLRRSVLEHTGRAAQAGDGDERARAAVGELSPGAQPPADARRTSPQRDLAAGTLGREEFLERFGHRGTNEMESEPRVGPRCCTNSTLVRSGDGHRYGRPRPFRNPGIVSPPRRS